MTLGTGRINRRIAASLRPGVLPRSRPSSGLRKTPRRPRAVFAFRAFLCLLLSPLGVGAQAPCTENLTLDWQFHAAAPLDMAPAVAPDGRVLVGSVDGYVHALDESGHFEWSFTLDAPPLGLAVSSDGRTFALNKDGQLQILMPNGQQQWGSRLPAGMLPTGPSVQNRAGVVYVPSALNLYAFSASAGLSWRAFVGSPIVSGPVLAADGDAWLTTKNGQVLRIRSPSQRSGFTLDVAREARVVSAGKGDVQVLEIGAGKRAELVSYDERGQERWRLTDVDDVSADGRLLRRRGPHGAEWTWVEPATGRVLQQRSLHLDASARPARWGERAVVASSSGKVYVFAPQGDVEWCRVASAPLLEPRVLQSAGRVVVSSGDGWIASLRGRGAHGRGSAP